jgi:hypothetical protein
MSETQRTRDLARAALFRERIIGALRAAPEPMHLADLYGMSGIVEMYHKSMIPQKVGLQIRALVKSGDVVRTGLGQYAIRTRHKEEALPERLQQGVALQHLQIEVNKQDNSIAFTLGGVRISVKVL